jgi:hypothetical protein
VLGLGNVSGNLKQMVIMNITVPRVKKELCKNYDWESSYFEDRPEFYDMLIRDVLRVVNEKLRVYKGDTIIKRKT